MTAATAIVCMCVWCVYSMYTHSMVQTMDGLLSIRMHTYRVYCCCGCWGSGAMDYACASLALVHTPDSDNNLFKHLLFTVYSFVSLLWFRYVQFSFHLSYLSITLTLAVSHLNLLSLTLIHFALAFEVEIWLQNGQRPIREYSHTVELGQIPIHLMCSTKQRKKKKETKEKETKKKEAKNSE